MPFFRFILCTNFTRLPTLFKHNLYLLFSLFLAILLYRKYRDASNYSYTQQAMIESSLAADRHIPPISCFMYDSESSLNNSNSTIVKTDHTTKISHSSVNLHEQNIINQNQ
jgi:hypothetical protein